MPYVLGLIGGISIGLILAVIILCKWAEKGIAEEDQEAIHIKTKIDNVLAQMFEIRYINGQNREIDDKILEVLYLTERYLNKTT